MKDIPNNLLVLLLVCAGVGAAAALPSNNSVIATSIIAIAGTAYQAQQGKQDKPNPGQQKKGNGNQL